MRTRAALPLVLLLLAGASIAGPTPEEAAAASPAPITIALISSLTGPSAPETASSPAGFYRANRLAER